MKFLIFVVLLGVLSNAQGQLQCYICDDCEDLSNEKLQYCGPTTTTMTTTTTTVPESSSEPPTTVDVTTEKSEETTNSTVITTAGEAETTADGTATTPTTAPTTTVAATETESTTTTTTATTVAATETESTTTTTTATTVAATEAETTTTTATTEAPTNAPAAAAADLNARSYRSLFRQRRDTSNVVYACYIIKIKDGNDSTTKVNRGCLEIPNGEKGCDYYNRENNVAASQVESCFTCQNDGCNNGSAAVRLSAFAFLFAFVFRYLN